MSKKNENVKPKFHLGRNLGTILLALLVLTVIAFAVYIPYTYINAKSKANSVPFDTNVTDTMRQKVGLSYEEQDVTVDGTATKTSTIMKKMTENTKVINGKDFKDFNFTFTATNYQNKSDYKDGKPVKDLSHGTVTFQMTFQWNAKTQELAPNGFDKLPTSASSTTLSSYNVYAYVCLTSDWASYEDKPVCLYNSSNTQVLLEPTHTKDTNNNETDEYVINTPSTVSINGISVYPFTAPTWPVAVTEKAPNAYVYLYYIYKDANNKKVENRVILKYTFDEYYTKDTKGGIE